MDYTRYRDIAKRLIPKYGTVGNLEASRQIPDPNTPWKSTTETLNIPLQLVVFPDDGVTFVDHNVTGNVRMALVAPSDQLNDVAIGDIITYGAQRASVRKYKTIDPDGSGPILWAILIA